MRKIIVIGLVVFLLSPIYIMAASSTDRSQLATPPGTRESYKIRPIASQQDGITTQEVSSATAEQLAAAMDIAPADLVSASIGTSDSGGVGVSTGDLGNYMPTDGDSFVILATGLATTAETVNDSESTSWILSGLNNAQVNDMVQLTLELNVPVGATCLSFDFAFYSEEFEEFVGSSFNDAFTAEIGGTDLTIVNNQVVAPLNFAFDTSDNIISVNTVFGVSENTGTTYDGATPLLRANSPIEPGTETVTIVLTIQDLGDSIYDSAVFIDNFFWGIGVDCSAGADVDSDGDALLDDWEENGIDIDNDGTIDLDLPAMGADPLHKDIFIEIDYMADSDHSHKPKSDALQKVIDAFANAPVDNPDGTQGIRLHIDAGPDSIMNPVTNAKWNSLSKSNSIAHDDDLGSLSGTNYDWTEFDTIRSNNFSVERRDVFHYSIFAHDLGDLGSVSGIARGIPAADFIVSLGSWTNGVGTVNQQAGTLMHELGHTLGLRHGGDDNANYEPNYLSVMNYAFQTRGLRINGVDGNFDYSRFAPPSLDESDLDETVGLNGTAVMDNYGTIFFCGGSQDSINNVNNAIDWNCSSSASETGVAEDINNDGNQTVLAAQNNWEHIVFNGGGIGQLGNDGNPPMVTEAEEITKEMDDDILTLFALAIDYLGELDFDAGESKEITITLANTGTLSDTYTITGTSNRNWLDSTSLPAADINLNPGESESFIISVTAPNSAPKDQTDSIKIAASSQNNPNLLDSTEFDITVITSDAGDDDDDGGGGGGGGGCFVNSLNH